MDAAGREVTTLLSSGSPVRGATGAIVPSETTVLVVDEVVAVASSSPPPPPQAAEARAIRPRTATGVRRTEPSPFEDALQRQQG
jgi:hypothetical protein